MKSLLLIGFPRGFTSEAYRISRIMLPDLKSSGVPAGEVLNQERNQAFAPIPFYVDETHPDAEHYYQACRNELLKYRDGFIVKDVVQPHLVLRFIKEHPECFNVLFVNRPIEHVKFSLGRKNWAFVRDHEALLESFKRFPALNVERAYFEPGAFEDALNLFYDHVLPHDYLSPDFIQTRDGFFRDFASDDWRFAYLPPSAERFSLTGFHPYEQAADICWSAEASFSVAVDLQQLPFKLGKLSFTLILPDGLQRSDYRLMYRYLPNQEAELPMNLTGQPYGLDIDLTGFDGGSLVVEFMNSQLVSPLNVGVSSDSRLLGAGVVSIGLFPATHSTDAPSLTTWASFKQSVSISIRKLWYAGKILAREKRLTALRR